MKAVPVNLGVVRVGRSLATTPVARRINETTRGFTVLNNMTVSEINE